MLMEAFDDQAMSHARVWEWQKRFIEDREEGEGCKRLARPVTGRTGRKII